MSTVHAALVELLGVEGANAFRENEIEGLERDGYRTVGRLKVASREGLRSCGLLPASVEVILAAQGEFKVVMLGETIAGCWCRGAPTLTMRASH